MKFTLETEIRSGAQFIYSNSYKKLMHGILNNKQQI